MTSTWRTKRQRILLALPAGALVACGTTVDGASQATGGAGTGGAGSGIAQGGLPGADLGSATGGLARRGGSSGGGPSQNGNDTGATSGGAGTGVVGTPSGVAKVLPRGEVRVGFVYKRGSNEQQATFGTSGGTADGDHKQMISALIKDANRQGGIAGRKIKPVLWEDDVNSSQPHNATEQAACATFTEDNDVFAAVIPANYSNLRECLRAKGVLVAAGGYTQSTDATFRDYPGYVEPGNLNLDGQARELPPALLRQRYFGSWDTLTGRPGTAATRVGVVTYDTPLYRHAVDKVLAPALAKVKHPPVATAYLPYPQSSSDVSGLGSAGSAAVLRFKQERITHVILMSEAGAFGFFFMNAGHSQAYNPRYAYTSSTVPQGVIAGGYATNPQVQFNGAKGIGWWPKLDLAPGDPQGATSSAHTRCLRIAKGEGVLLPSTWAESVMARYCDGLWVLRAAFEESNSLSHAGFFRGLDALSTRYVSAVAPATALSARRRAGVSAIYDYGYVNSCNCWRYSGPARAVR